MTQLHIDISRFREMVSEVEVKVHWVDGKLYLADSLTKRDVSTLKFSKVLETSKLRN